MMTRSIWKLPYIHRVFFSNEYLQGKFITTWLRDSVISPHFVNRSFALYNGTVFVSITINNDMVGRKFGEYSVTKSLGYRETKKNSKKRSTKFKKK